MTVIAPYWDCSNVFEPGQIRYQVISGSSSIITEVNKFLSNYFGFPFEADWILWVYWHCIDRGIISNCSEVTVCSSFCHVILINDKF